MIDLKVKHRRYNIPRNAQSNLEGWAATRTTPCSVTASRQKDGGTANPTSPFSSAGGPLKIPTTFCWVDKAVIKKEGVCTGTFFEGDHYAVITASLGDNISGGNCCINTRAKGIPAQSCCHCWSRHPQLYTLLPRVVETMAPRTSTKC